MQSSGRSTPTTDRISSLPDPILCHILSFLPTKSAAATSILSKRWKPVWLSVQTLDFDDKPFKSLVFLLNNMFSTIFLRDITLPIHSFRFEWKKNSSCNQTEVNQIFNFVLQRGIPNFYFRPSKQFPDNVFLPLTILNCRTLKVLKLSKIMVGDISHCMDIHLPILKTFHLKKVCFECPENFEKLLLGCPVLEELVTKESCELEDRDGLHSQTKFKALPNLIKARIHEFRVPISMVSKAKILRLRLDHWAIRDQLDVFDTLPVFQSLTHLELNFKDVVCCYVLRWIWLLKILKYYPKLQNLMIQDTKATDEDRCKIDREDPPIVPECLSSQLKTCCIRGYRGAECDLKFAKFIIENSKVLNTMIINSVSSIDKDEKDQMQVKLSSCTMGSTTCKLLFN